MSLRKINLNLVKKVDYIQDKDGGKKLDLPDITEEELPGVSVVTITKNRKKLFPIAIYNWEKFIYPREKLEWIIVDDGEEDLTDLLPKDKRIKYIKCPPMDIGDKRNFSVENASWEYINHMDDDDYHFPDSILAKIRCLLKYRMEFIYCNSIGVWDSKTKSSIIFDDTQDVPELAITYTKKFWEKKKFCRLGDIRGMYEAFEMCKKRETEMLVIDFWFVLISITHGKNVTRNMRKVKTNNSASFWDVVFPQEFKAILKKIKI